MKNRKSIFFSITLFCIGTFIGHYGYSKVIQIEKVSKGVNRAQVEHYRPNPMRDLRIELRGDAKAYKEQVQEVRRLSPNHPDYLYSALIMANLKGYIPANYDVYRAIVDLYELNHIEINEQSYNLAMHYLRRGSMLGDSLASQELNRKGQGTVR